MKIDDAVRSELNSFENSELERILETMEQHEYYISGLKSINGGYVTATAFSADEEEVEIELESGVQDMGDGHSRSEKSCHTIKRMILSEVGIGRKEKMQAIEEA